MKMTTVSLGFHLRKYRMIFIALKMRRLASSRRLYIYLPVNMRFCLSLSSVKNIPLFNYRLGAKGGLISEATATDMMMSTMTTDGFYLYCWDNRIKRVEEYLCKPL